MFRDYLVALLPGSTDSLSASEHLDVKDLGRRVQQSGLSIVHQICADMMAEFAEGAALSELDVYNKLVGVNNDSLWILSCQCLNSLLLENEPPSSSPFLFFIYLTFSFQSIWMLDLMASLMMKTDALTKEAVKQINIILAGAGISIQHNGQHVWRGTGGVRVKNYRGHHWRATL